MLPPSLQSAFTYGSSVVFAKIIERSVWFLQRGVPADDQVQEPKEWTPELTVLKSMQVNKKNSPGPGQVQNCWPSVRKVFTLSLSFTPSPHPALPVERITAPLKVVNDWHRVHSRGFEVGLWGLLGNYWQPCESWQFSQRKGCWSRVLASWYREATCKWSWTDFLTFSYPWEGKKIG